MISTQINHFNLSFYTGYDIPPPVDSNYSALVVLPNFLLLYLYSYDIH